MNLEDKVSSRGAISRCFSLRYLNKALETSCTIPFLWKPMRNLSLPSKVGYLLGKFYRVRFSLWIN